MKLTKDFSKKEFDSKDGANMPATVLVNVRELATNLQVLRDAVQLPIVITSGYRSVSHNKKIGGAEGSKHTLGQAADFKIPGMTAKQVYEVVLKLIQSGKMKKGGLHAYSTWVHYDIRGFNARW